MHNDLYDEFICSIAFYIDYSTLCTIDDGAFDLWQQFLMASENKSALRVTVDKDRRWLLNLIVASLDCQKPGAIDVKICLC